MHFDAVFWGAILSVAVAVAIVVYLGFKVVHLMNLDAAKHAQAENESTPSRS